jgi:hypothetical protein
VKPSARTDGAAAITSKAQAATATSKTRVRAQIPSDETKRQEAGVMAASLLWGHHRTNIFPATAVFMEGQHSGQTISARRFRIPPFTH